MNKSIKKTLCVLTAVLVASAGFASCKSKNDPNNNQSSQSGVVQSAESAKSTLAFKPSEILAPEGASINGSIAYRDGLYYACSSKYNDDGTSEAKVLVFDESGLKTEIPVNKCSAEEWGTFMGELNIGDDGSVTVVYMLYDNSDEGKNKYTLYKFDKDGNQISSEDMSDVFNIADTSDDRAYMSNFLFDKDGNLIINFSSSIRVVSPTGEKLFDIPMENENSNINSLITTNAGVPAFLYTEWTSGETKYTLIEIDVNAKGKGKTYDLTAAMAYIVYPGSGDFVCYTKSDTGISGVRADGSRENVLNLLNLGVDNSGSDSFVVNSDGSFVMSMWDMETGSTKIVHVKPVDPSTVKEKKIITLGCYSIPWNLRSAIADFNKKSDEFVIATTSYSDTNDTASDAALTKFNNELLTGNIPDILLVDPTMPYQSYVAKGLFADLYPVIDADPDMSREDILPNVLTALETDGKLMSMATSFTVQTFATKPELVDNEGYLRMSAASEAAASTGASLGAAMNREDFLKMGIYFSNYIDLKNRSCNFDNDSFKLLLNESKKHPETIDWDEWMNDPDSQLNMEKAFIEGRELLQSISFSSFDFYSERAHLGDNYVFTNFPSESPVTKSILTPGIRLAISEKSANKQAAWDFIEEVMKETLRADPYTWWSEDGASHTVEDDIRYDTFDGLPVIKKDFETLKEHATDRNHYYDEKGKAVYEDRTVWIADSEVKVNDMTKEEVQAIADSITSCNTALESYEEIYNTIIKDEVQNFWAGTTTAEQAAQMVQSRVSLYISEHY